MDDKSEMEHKSIILSPDEIPPPPYSEASNSKSVTTVQYGSPEPQLAWYKQQCCVLGNHKAVESPLVEIVINDKTGMNCIANPERLNHLLDEQINRPPRPQMRIIGSHYGTGKQGIGNQIDFDIWLDADLFVAPELSSISLLRHARVVDRHTVDSTQFWANWVHRDYGRTKVILIEREFAGTISDQLKEQIIETVRGTNYSGNIDISIHVEHDKTLITRQEITSRTIFRHSPEHWPTSFSILRDRPKSDETIKRLKEDVEEDICPFKVLWAQREISTDRNAKEPAFIEDKSLQKSRSQSRSRFQGTTKLEENWLSAWQVSLQNAIIEIKEDSRSSARFLSSKDQNDADVIGLRRRPPKKTWGGPLFSMRGSKMFHT